MDIPAISAVYCQLSALFELRCMSCVFIWWFLFDLFNAVLRRSGVTDWEVWQCRRPGLLCWGWKKVRHMSRTGGHSCLSYSNWTTVSSRSIVKCWRSQANSKKVCCANCKLSRRPFLTVLLKLLTSYEIFMHIILSSKKIILIKGIFNAPCIVISLEMVGKA